MPYLRRDLSCSSNKSDVLVDAMKILSREDVYIENQPFVPFCKNPYPTHFREVMQPK